MKHPASFSILMIAALAITGCVSGPDMSTLEVKATIIQLADNPRACHNRLVVSRGVVATAYEAAGSPFTVAMVRDGAELAPVIFTTAVKMDDTVEFTGQLVALAIGDSSRENIERAIWKALDAMVAYYPDLNTIGQKQLDQIVSFLAIDLMYQFTMHREPFIILTDGRKHEKTSASGQIDI